MLANRRRDMAGSMTPEQRYSPRKPRGESRCVSVFQERPTELMYQGMSSSHLDVEDGIEEFR